MAEILTGIRVDGPKLSLIAIGSAKNTRWPKPPNSAQFARAPVTYYSSKKGWMTAQLFEKLLADLEMQCVRAVKKTLKLLDNCPAHSSFQRQYNGEITFFRVLRLLKNTTSKP